jgi:hypothetical protein
VSADGHLLLLAFCAPCTRTDLLSLRLLFPTIFVENKVVTLTLRHILSPTPASLTFDITAYPLPAQMGIFLLTLPLFVRAAIVLLSVCAIFVL